MAYSFGKTVVKVIEVVAFGAVGAVISWASGLPPTETILACVAILKAIENFLKHKDDI